MDTLGPDGRPRMPPVKTEGDDAAALQREERVDEGPRLASQNLDCRSSRTSLPLISARRPTLRATDQRWNVCPGRSGRLCCCRDRGAIKAGQTERRPAGSKNRRPDWEHNPLLAATRAHTTAGRSAVNGTSLSLYGEPSAASTGVIGTPAAQASSSPHRPTLSSSSTPRNELAVSQAWASARRPRSSHPSSRFGRTQARARSRRSDPQRLNIRSRDADVRHLLPV